MSHRSMLNERDAYMKRFNKRALLHLVHWRDKKHQWASCSAFCRMQDTFLANGVRMYCIVICGSDGVIPKETQQYQVSSAQVIRAPNTYNIKDGKVRWYNK